jgi:hypothetical protein
MSDQVFNANSFTYYGTANTTTGGTAIDVAKLPDFDEYEMVAFTNLHATDSIAFKTGIAGVTVGHPASNDTALATTIIAAGTTRFLRKEKAHTTFAVDSLAGAATFVVQYGNGDR